MNELKIEIAQNRTAFEPGDEITGSARWRLDKPPREVELRLFWFTRGQGTEDAGVVETRPFEHPLAEDTRSFRVRLPEAPYSFSGKLLSIVWALELVARPAREAARVEIVMGPGGRTVQLDHVSESGAGGTAPFG